MSFSAIVLAFVVHASQPQEVSPPCARAEQLVETLRTGDLAEVMAFWSDRAPSKASDRRTIASIIDDRPWLSFALGDVTQEKGHAVVALEVRRGRAPYPLLDRYLLEWSEGPSGWEAWGLESDQVKRAATALGAVRGKGRRAASSEAPSISLVRELLRQGADLLDAARVDEAVPPLTLALQLGEKVNDGPTRAAALRAMARLESATGDENASRHFYEESIPISQSSDDFRGLGRALNNLGASDVDRSDYPLAETHLQAALDAYRRINDRRGAAGVFSNIANLRSLQGDYEGSRTNYEAGLNIYVQLDDKIGTSTILSNLGIDDRLQGAYSSALARFHTALEISRAENDLEGIADALGNMGNTLHQQGKYIDALESYQQSLVITRKIGNTIGVAVLLSNLGQLYSSLGNQSLALDYHQQSYRLAKQAGYKETAATALHNIGEVWSRRGDSAQALTYYKRALAVDEEIENLAGISIDLNDVGLTLAKLGHPLEARKAFTRTLEIAEKIRNREGVVLALNNLAELTKAPAEREAAESYALRAVKAAEELGLPQRIWETHLALGRIYRRSNQLQKARAEVERSIAVVEELRRGIPGEEMAQQAFEEMVQPYREMVALLVAKGDLHAALEYSERAKGRVLLDVLEQGRTNVSQAMTGAEHDEEEKLLTQLARVNRGLYRELSADTRNAEAVRDLETKVHKARFDYEAFLAGLYAAHPQLRVVRGEIAPIAVADVGALLKERADAVLEFVVADDATYLFVITPQPGGGIDVRAHVVAIGEEALAREVSRFRKALAGRDLSYAAMARSLFTRLVRPAEDQIGTAKLLCIIPDGPLWELPFQALLARPSEFLLDRHAIFYTSSLTVLREAASKHSAAADAAQKPQLLAFGNPLLPAGTTSRLRALYRDASLGPIPETESEIREIAALYGKEHSRVFVGRAAREDVLKAEAGNFNILHFATHGILDDQSPMYSRLLFAPAGGALDDGLLEAREIMRLDLHASLAVLSACETGRGRVGAGEGLIGMSWAFFVAGCPTTVVSQWSVSSASTSELMVEFHRRLQHSAGRAEALRSAALEVRSNPAHRHPFYWAAFVIVGEGG